MIYFDNAATSFQKPFEVISAVNIAMTEYCANPGRSGHDLSVKTAEQIYKARVVINEFFNGYGEEFVSFTSNCTEALNTAIKGILKKGDHVVISTLEHNSVVRPIHKLKSKGLVDYTVFDVFDDVEEIIKSFKRAIRKKTRLCVVTAVSNVFGHILPLKALSDIAHDNNILFFVDGAQGAGVIPIDMKFQGIDCLCVPGHKGLLGPMGTGAILHKNLPFNTLIEGGTGTNSLELYQPLQYPEKLESGTLNVPGICGLCSGVQYVKKMGVDSIFQKENEIAKEIFYGLKQMPKIKLYREKYDEKICAPVISFNMNELHSEQISQMLNVNNVAVRGGYQCSPLAHKFMGTTKTGTVRVSPCIFNTKKDINILLNLVEKIAFDNYI